MLLVFSPSSAPYLERLCDASYPSQVFSRWRPLQDIYEERSFAITVRNVCLVGALIAFTGETLSLYSEAIPPDIPGTITMAVVFLIMAWMAHRRVPRSVLAVTIVITAAVLGWYHARMARDDFSSILVNQGSIFLVIVGCQAVLELSLIEFIISVGVYAVTLMGLIIAYTQAQPSDFLVLAFYVTATAGLSSVGIVGRSRLRRGQRQAREALVQLNDELETKVRDQVARIRQAELLRRFLPPELADSLTDGQLPISHVRRQVAILCAAPAGFLESLSHLEEHRVVDLVNAYVSGMSRVAADYGGVVERIVGPRMTVIFGAIEEKDPAQSVQQALGMARAMQREANELLTEWETLGVSQVRLRLAVGVAHGSAVIGTFGSERRVDYSALGGVMVRAVRLSSEAIPGEIRLDEAAALRAPKEFEVSRAESVEFTPGEPKPCFIVVQRSSQEASSEDGREVPWDSGHTVTRTLVGSASGESEPSTRRSGPDLQLGSLFDGRYRIEALVGRGGMASVYRAKHLALGQLRALKVFSSVRLTSPDAVEQFRREAEATARLHHPSVVRLHDFGRSLEGYYYLVLDLVEGPTLASTLSLHKSLPLERAVQIGTDILEALAAAHARHLVHQDLKPSNVLLGRDGRALVTDFGLVTFVGMQTADASFGGTPAYMSPEQWKNEPLDERSDLYAWGVLMFQMLSSELPLSAPSVHEFFSVASHERPGPVSDRCVGVPATISDLIASCLEKEPSQRPDSAREVLTILTNAYNAARSVPSKTGRREGSDPEPVIESGRRASSPARETRESTSDRHGSSSSGAGATSEESIPSVEPRRTQPSPAADQEAGPSERHGDDD